MREHGSGNKVGAAASGDPPAARTAYRRVEADLRSRIQDGTWPEGTMLPSRTNLAQEYHVAVHTIQRAIAHLLDDGTLTADSGRGTFVSANVASSSRKRPAVRSPSTDWQDPEFVLPALRPPLPPMTRLGILATIPDDAEIAYSLIGVSWTNAVISSLERAFSDLGGKTRFFNLRVVDRKSNVEDVFSEVETVGIHAVVGVSLYENPILESDLTARLLHSARPAALVTWQPVSQGIPHVFYDQRFAGYRAAQYLLQRGYYPLLVPARFMEPWLEERIAGAREAVRDGGFPEEGLQVFLRAATAEQKAADPLSVEVAREAFTWLGQKKESSQRWGIIAPNDGRASGVLHAAGLIGREAGRDFGLIGFDDDPRSRIVGLTSVRPPLEEMGVEVARLIARMLRGENQSIQIRLNSSVVARRSTDPTATRNVF